MFRRQIRQGHNFHPIFQQFFGFLSGTGAVNIIFLCLAIMDFARLFGKFIASTLVNCDLNPFCAAAEQPYAGRYDRPLPLPNCQRALQKQGQKQVFCPLSLYQGRFVQPLCDTGFCFGVERLGLRAVFSPRSPQYGHHQPLCGLFLDRICTLRTSLQIHDHFHSERNFFHLFTYSTQFFSQSKFFTRCQLKIFPWQCLYFLPEPHGHGALRGTLLS